jgi:hypothetical protein
MTTIGRGASALWVAALATLLVTGPVFAMSSII